VRKLDLRRQLKHLYQPPKGKVVVVEVPRMQFLMVDGKGDPDTAPAFQQAIEALYGVSYTLKFMMKQGPAQVDYPVMALEGLWWVKGAKGFSQEIWQQRGKWQWTLMIMQPDLITPDLVAQAIQQVRERRNPAALDQVRFEAFAEGPSAQIMHIGPFAEELPTIQKLHRFIAEGGHRPRGKHHEIYLSDFRRTKPENLKTVLRQPFA
jgi:hypothetical protein